ncbi:hypothetical protein ABZ494_32360 [Nocardia amamiensis]
MGGGELPALFGGLLDAGERIERAVAPTFAAGIATADLGGHASTGEFTQQVCAGALSLNPAIAPRRTRLGRFGCRPVGTTSGFLAANSW